MCHQQLHNKRVNQYFISIRDPQKSQIRGIKILKGMKTLKEAKLMCEEIGDDYVGHMLVIQRVNDKNCGIWRKGIWRDVVGIYYVGTYWPYLLWKKWHQGDWLTSNRSMSIYFKNNLISHVK